MSFVDPASVGRWEGNVFVVDPPITVTDEDGQQYTMRRVDCSQLILPNDMSRDDVIHAMLNPIVTIRDGDD